jgi:2,3-bisphosphoglycerate-dependent phosphoglycerate mutase
MSPPSVFIVVRHGQSEHHVRGLTGGWTDTPLTPLGHEQAARVAARLRGELGGAPVSLYSSDLKRAMQTAEHIGEALGIAPVADARLREHNNGDAADLTVDEARARFGEAWGRPAALDARSFPRAETWRQFFDRTAPFVDELNSSDAIPIAVTHGGTIINIVARWLGLPVSALKTAGFAAHPASLFVLQFDAHGRRIAERMNDVAHLTGMEGDVSIRSLLGGQ